MHLVLLLLHTVIDPQLAEHGFTYHTRHLAKLQPSLLCGRLNSVRETFRSHPDYAYVQHPLASHGSDVAP